MSRYLALGLIFALILVVGSLAATAATFEWGKPISLAGVYLTKQSRDCVECHLRATPFIVYDWYKSKHRMVGVGCYECHYAPPGSRPDVFEHYGYYITLIVTPKQCARCHPAIVQEYEASVHAFAGLHAYKLAEFPAFWTIVADQFEWTKEFKIPEKYIITEWVPKWVREYVGDEEYGREVLYGDPTNAIVPYNPLKLDIDKYYIMKALTLWGIRGCLQCHGARFDIKDAYAYPDYDTLLKLMKEGKAAPKVIFDPAFITNHGIGRVNPDGSLGSCEACHPYHGFSVKIARKGGYQACGRCHCGPDHPNDEQWSKSVHGAIFWGEGEDWNWDAPVNNWIPGRDYRAPTCAACHMAAVVNPYTGEVKYASSHDAAIICKFKLGRWLMTIPRLPGMPDPAIPGATPKKAAEYVGPTGEAIKLVYPAPDWKARRQRAIEMCAQCHTKRFAASWLKTYDWMIILVDYMRDYYVLPVSSMLKEKGLFTPLDKLLVRNLGAMANRPTKMAAAHMGPDFVWWEGIVHFTLHIEEWLIEVIERPAVKKKAPEIIEYVKKILPWFEEKWEGVATTGSVHRLAEVGKEVVFKEIEAAVKSLPGIEEYKAKLEAELPATMKPLVKGVTVTGEAVATFDVPSTGLEVLALLPLLAPAVAAVLAVRAVAA